MAMTYTQLVASNSTAGSIKNIVNRSDLPVEDILLDAQMEIFTRMRVREMRSVTTLSLAQGDLSVALPTGFLDPISIKDQYYSDLIQQDMDALLGMRATDGDGDPVEAEPVYYAIWDEKFQFDCAMNAALSFTLLYFKSPTLLSGSNETNFMTTRYPHLLRAACRKHAEIFTKNYAARDRAEDDLQKFLALIEQHDDLSYRGVSPAERG